MTQEGPSKPSLSIIHTFGIHHFSTIFVLKEHLSRMCFALNLSRPEFGLAQLMAVRYDILRKQGHEAVRC